MNTSDHNPSPSQLRLPFPDTITGFDDLAITDANRGAVDTVCRWESWKHVAMCLVGPVQCGLGIMARLWAREAGAGFIDAADFDRLSVSAVEALAAENCALDLADKVQSESNLLTLLNFASEKQTRVLLTARAGAGTWQCQNADLKSRLDALPVAEIYAPDEPMVSARLTASCKRRYIKLNKATIAYLVVRLPRSYAAIEDYVSRLDQAISDTGRPASMHLARTVLEEGSSTRKLFGDDTD